MDEDKKFKDWLMWNVKYLLRAVMFFSVLIPLVFLLPFAKTSQQIVSGIIGLLVLLSFVLHKYLDKKFPDDREMKIK